MQRLLRFALDDDAPDNIALAAIRDALDRAGVIAPKTVDVAIATRPFEEVFDSIAGGSREQSRKARGHLDVAPNALESSGLEQLSLPLEVVDVEPIERQSRDFQPEPYPRRQYVTPPITGDEAIAEAARINRELGVYDRKALPPRRY